jgi:uncharacterized phosphatase
MATRSLSNSMSEGTIMFVRHGQSTANFNNEIATDSSPLTELGKYQARDAAKQLQEKQITKIVSSPLLRAQQTAKIIAQELGMKEDAVETLEILRERGLGDLRGVTKTEDSSYYFTVDDAHNVESRAHLLVRMNECYSKLKVTAEGSTIVAVGHAVAGAFLYEASRGVTRVEDLGPPKEIPNALPFIL